MTREIQVTFDCADPAALAAFWAEALGYQLQAPPGDFASWEAALEAFGVPREEWNSRSAILPTQGSGPRLFFQRVPEGKVAKNRVHLDVRVAGHEIRGEERKQLVSEKVEQLVQAGASLAWETDDVRGSAIVLRDPEGNEFCVS